MPATNAAVLAATVVIVVIILLAAYVSTSEVESSIAESANKKEKDKMTAVYGKSFGHMFHIPGMHKHHKK